MVESLNIHKMYPTKAVTSKIFTSKSKMASDKKLLSRFRYIRTLLAKSFTREGPKVTNGFSLLKAMIPNKWRALPLHEAFIDVGKNMREKWMTQTRKIHALSH